MGDKCYWMVNIFLSDFYTFVSFFALPRGYKPEKISTIVDFICLAMATRGYKPEKISTIVD